MIVQIRNKLLDRYIWFIGVLMLVGATWCFNQDELVNGSVENPTQSEPDESEQVSTGYATIAQDELRRDWEACQLLPIVEGALQRSTQSWSPMPRVAIECIWIAPECFRYTHPMGTYQICVAEIKVSHRLADKVEVKDCYLIRVLVKGDLSRPSHSIHREFIKQINEITTTYQTRTIHFLFEWCNERIKDQPSYEYLDIKWYNQQLAKARVDLDRSFALLISPRFYTDNCREFDDKAKFYQNMMGGKCNPIWGVFILIETIVCTNNCQDIELSALGMMIQKKYIRVFSIVIENINVQTVCLTLPFLPRQDGARYWRTLERLTLYMPHAKLNELSLSSQLVVHTIELRTLSWADGLYNAVGLNKQSVFLRMLEVVINLDDSTNDPANMVMVRLMLKDWHIHMIQVLPLSNNNPNTNPNFCDRIICSQLVRLITAIRFVKGQIVESASVGQEDFTSRLINSNVDWSKNEEIYNNRGLRCHIDKADMLVYCIMRLTVCFTAFLDDFYDPNRTLPAVAGYEQQRQDLSDAEAVMVVVVESFINRFSSLKLPWDILEYSFQKVFNVGRLCKQLYTSSNDYAALPLLTETISLASLAATVAYTLMLQSATGGGMIVLGAYKTQLQNYKTQLQDLLTPSENNTLDQQSNLI
ncbi:hypothetical protein NEHOM01_0853 [Nematocida homosporus]|uniref:uncharacterized protein n=1 Tax=Nematocida homosporus TaxID=1912981 RepID=UPI00221F454B|nr:uncharacterized protein NEHOM01_0853 [Nematocida homosporus]KAI5185494.1 hypothetical protein NEHOM01_0853 [Nematocida homosporus]